MGEGIQSAKDTALKTGKLLIGAGKALRIIGGVIHNSPAARAGHESKM